jgi:hypothetical protein
MRVSLSKLRNDDVYDAVACSLHLTLKNLESMCEDSDGAQSFGKAASP